MIVPTKNLPIDLQVKEWGCASGHILAGGQGAGRGLGRPWPGMRLICACPGGEGHQQGELRSVRSHLAPSVRVPMLLRGPVGADGRDMPAGLVACLLSHLWHWWQHGYGHIPRLCGQGNILPPPFPDVSLIFSSPLPKFSCILLLAAIWLCVLGAGDSTRSLWCCDQPYHICSPKKRRGSSPVCNRHVEANTAGTHVTPFSSHPIPFSNQWCIHPAAGTLEGSWTSFMGFYSGITVLQWYMDQTALDDCMHKGIYKKHSVICLANTTPRKYLYLILPAKLHMLQSSPPRYCCAFLKRQ